MLLLVTVSVMVTLNMFLPTHCFKQCVDHEFYSQTTRTPRLSSEIELNYPSLRERSFVAQSDHGIHSACAPCGKVCGQ